MRVIILAWNGLGLQDGSLGARAVGAAERLLQMAIDYAKGTGHFW